MGWIEDFLKKLVDNISESIRKFSAYSMILFFLGGIYGYYSGHLASFLGVDPVFVLGIPVLLAILAYLFTEIAVFLFIGLLLLAAVLFI